MSGALRMIGGTVALYAALACDSSARSGKDAESGGSSALAGAAGAHGGAQAGDGGSAPGSGGSVSAGAATSAGGGPSASGGSVASAGGSGTGGGSGRGGGQSSGGASSGGAGSGGTSSGGASAFHCPAGPFPAPVPAGAAAQRIDGVPPADAFNGQGNTRTNIEGPVFIGGVLYVSEFPFTAAPTSRILAISVAGTPSVSVALSGIGSNGMAVDAAGNLIATNHVKGAVERYSFPLGTPTTLIATYDGKRFNSPNDLAVRSDGTVYFSDPDYQAPPRPLPQTATRVYRLPPGASEAVVIDATRSEPNGVTLSPDEKTLYVAGADGILSYPVQPDGSVASGSGVRIQGFNGSADGLGVDCAGNLYAASGKRVAVLSAAGMEIGSVPVDQAEQVTNVAFGGESHKTLFITSMGTGGQRGVFRVDLAVPGFPY